MVDVIVPQQQWLLAWSRLVVWHWRSCGKDASMHLVGEVLALLLVLGHLRAVLVERRGG